jgi:hypothetical protein
VKALAIWAKFMYNTAALVERNPEITEQLSPFAHRT